MSHGVHRYPPPRAADLRTEEKRERERREHDEQHVQRPLAHRAGRRAPRPDGRATSRSAGALLQLPQENILYFLEKTAPRLQPWQREILRIVRLIAQYFYPQRQTKVMNEGCATYVPLPDHEPAARAAARSSDGALHGVLHSHTNVIFQPDFDDPRYSGINPYALGFAMMQDIERICRDAHRRRTASGSPISPAAATRWRCCATSGPITATRASSCSSSARA